MSELDKIPEIFSHGTAWLRADFHLHTRKDKEFSYKGEADRFVSDYVEGLKRAEIRVGVITNHNKFDRDEFKALRKRARKEDILLLPGVELSTAEGAGGIHTLIVFDDKWLENGNDYISPFITRRFPGKSAPEYQNENGRSDKNLLQLHEELDKESREYFFIFAHVERKRGLWKELSGGRLEDFATDRYAVVRRCTLGFQGVDTRDERSRVKSLLGNWYPAEVEGSDCKSVEDIGTGKAGYVKLGAFSFDALKYALMDKDARTASEQKKCTHSHIRSMKFTGGALDGKKILFSPELNAFIGIDDNAEVVGLSADEIRRLNQMVSNAASQNVRPPVNPLTEIISVGDRNILIVEIPKGVNKPYQDKNGVVWVKNGADKRKATSGEELQRLFQSSGMVHADVTPASGMTVADLDMPYFREFFQRRYGESLDSQSVPLAQTVKNMNLGRDGNLNLTGALLFGQSPSVRLPAFIVKAAVFPGDTVAADSYIDNRDITGKMSDIFQQTLSFILLNIRHVQGEQSVNSVGLPEIPKIVFEELLVNALVHRDYFIAAPVRVFVFADRVEITSPGHLPNDLTIANIKAGNSNVRNPVLASFAYQILPYRGFGSGILRALESYPHIEFVDDRENNRFQCVIKRT